MFCCVWAVALVIVGVAVIKLWDRSEAMGFVTTYPIDVIVVGGVVAVPILPAYLVSRMVFTRLRWQAGDEEEPYCVHCDYDLTGNVSGVCPECGQRIQNDASEHSGC